MIELWPKNQDKDIHISWFRRYNSVLKSIIPIAMKHNLDPKQLIKSFAKSWRNNVSQCGNLTIYCRVVNHDSASFLITDDEKIISQFPIKLEVLKHQIPQYYEKSIIFNTVK